MRVKLVAGGNAQQLQAMHVHCMPTGHFVGQAGVGRAHAASCALEKLSFACSTNTESLPWG